MTISPASPSHGASVAARYREYGAWAGFALGIIVAAGASGAHLREWALWFIAAILLACAVAGALLGYFAISLFTGSIASGASAGVDGGGPSDIGGAYGGDVDGWGGGDHHG